MNIYKVTYSIVVTNNKMQYVSGNSSFFEKGRNASEAIDNFYLNIGEIKKYFGDAQIENVKITILSTDEILNELNMIK